MDTATTSGTADVTDGTPHTRWTIVNGATRKLLRLHIHGRVINRCVTCDRLCTTYGITCDSDTILRWRMKLFGSCDDDGDDDNGLPPGTAVPPYYKTLTADDAAAALALGAELRYTNDAAPTAPPCWKQKLMPLRPLLPFSNGCSHALEIPWRLLSTIKSSSTIHAHASCTRMTPAQPAGGRARTCPRSASSPTRQPISV